MKIAMTKRRFLFLAITQSLLVLAATAIWFYFRTETYLAGPGDGDLYAHTRGFQWLSYFIVYLPGALLISGIILAAEHSWFFRQEK